MPRKLDLSDRYARAGQRRERRRVVSRPDDLTVQPAEGRQTAEPPAAQPSPATDMRPVTRGRPAPVTSYHYIRADLVRIAVVTGIILVLMAVLFVVLR